MERARKDWGDDQFEAHMSFGSKFADGEASCNKHLEPALKTVNQFLLVSSAVNASIVVTTFCGVLSRTDVTTSLRQWFDDFDDSYGAKSIVFNKIRAMKYELDHAAAKLSLRYFFFPNSTAGGCPDDTSLEPKAGAWFYSVLQRGALYFPDNEKEISWKEDPTRYSHRYFQPWWGDTLILLLSCVVILAGGIQFCCRQ